MESLENIGAYIVLLSETNVDYLVHDNKYDTHLLNRHIWKPYPVKKVVASCKWKKYSRTTYQKGGTLALLANSMPSKIHKQTNTC